MKRLGILGGGQLGRMLLQRAADYPLEVCVLDPDPQAPCRSFCNQFTTADFRDPAKVEDFGRSCDAVTLEIENVSVEGLARLQQAGVRVVPEPEVLAVIVDKGTQKTFYRDNGFPTAPFLLVTDSEDTRQAVREGFTFQKLRRSGYDGYGVRDLSAGETPLEGPSVMERRLEVAAELAVIAARDPFGMVVTYPAVEMVFHPQVHRLQYQLCPASLPFSVTDEAEKLAARLISTLNMTGLLAVEFILDKDGKLWVNECAPRPHNSGHHTIEAFDISQYDMLLRILQGLPVRPPQMRSPSAMVNILGGPQASGVPDYKGFLRRMAGEVCYLHLYGKERVKPLRKMGHLTLLEADREKLRHRAAALSEIAYIEARNTGGE